MDDLDKQLAELQLINNTELPPNPTLQRPGTAGRKIAPVVPPKPKKPQPQECLRLEPQTQPQNTPTDESPNFRKQHNSHIAYLLSKSKLGLGGENTGTTDRFTTIKSFYEELDDIPEVSAVLRVLELAENLEVIFDFEASSILDLDPTQSSSTSGSCDYKTGRLYLGAKHDFASVLGTLAHEFTHLAVQIVYDNECNPYEIEDVRAKSDFARIIEECRKSETAEQIVKRVFTAYKNPEDWASELIVRVPHLLAYYKNRDDSILSDFRALFGFFREKTYRDLLDFTADPHRIRKRQLIRKLNDFLGELHAIRTSQFNLREIKINLDLMEGETVVLLITNSPILAKLDLYRTLEGASCIWARIADFSSEKTAGEIWRAAQSGIVVVDCSEDYGSKEDGFWKSQTTKLVLISNSEEINHHGRSKIIRLLYNWDDLTEDSQRFLLETTEINFQGTLTKLNQVIPENSRLHHKFFERILLGTGEIIVGEAPAVLTEIDYIERGLIIAGRPCLTPTDLIRISTNKTVVISDEVGVGKTTILKHISKQIKEIYPNFWVSRLNLIDYSEIFEEFAKNKIEFAELLLQMLDLTWEGEAELFRELLKEKRVIFLLDSFDELDPPHKNIVIDLLEYLQQIRLEQIWITTRFYMETQFHTLTHVISCYLQPLTQKDQLQYLRSYWRKFLGIAAAQNDSNLEIFALNLLETISQTINDTEFKFTSTPLHLHMLAASFEEEIQNFVESPNFDAEMIPIELNLLGLYEKFIDRKYLGYVFDKITTTDARDIAEMLADGANLRKIHQFLALDVLFPNDKDCFPKPKRLHTLPAEKLNKIGIAEYLGKKPRFIHRTFAEYFIADLIANRLAKAHRHSDAFQDIFLGKILLGDDSRVIRSFLDGLLRKNPPCPEQLNSYAQKMSQNFQNFKPTALDRLELDAPIPKIIQLDKKIYQNWRNSRNSTYDLGGTILHQAIQENKPNILDFLLNSLKQVEPTSLFLHQNALGQTIWHGACVAGNTQISRNLLAAILANSSDEDTRKKLLLSPDYDNRHPYLWIAIHNNLNLLEIASNHLNLQDLFWARDNIGRHLIHWVSLYATDTTLTRIYSTAKSAQIDLGALFRSTDYSGRNLWHFAVWNPNPKILETLWTLCQEFGPDLPSDILYKSNLIQSGNLNLLERTWSLIKRAKIDLEEVLDHPSANPLHLAVENPDQNILAKLLDYTKEADQLKTLCFTKYSGHDLWTLILTNNDLEKLRLLWSFFKTHQLFYPELRTVLFKPDVGDGSVWYKRRPEFVQLLWEIAGDIGVDLKDEAMLAGGRPDLAVWNQVVPPDNHAEIFDLL